MENILNHAEDLLNRYVGGFHRYVLADPVHLDYVSENLCSMLGLTKRELLCEDADAYARLVHPADRERYAAFLNSMKGREQTRAAEYRLVNQDGAVIHVRDTMTSAMEDGGVLAGYSVLSDITEQKDELQNLRYLSETVSCGFLTCTCEKQPRITYINRQMREFLRIPETRDGEVDYLEMYKSDLFLLIPMEERRKFALYLNRVYSAGTPMAGEMTVLRCDGTRAYLFGWVAKCVDELGREVFQTVCIDVTERHQVQKANETQRYLDALTDVYDKIFEYDFSRNTVVCLNSHNSPMFKWLENIPMQMEDATEKWISETVIPEDRERVRAFFDALRQKKLYRTHGMPPQITYQAKSSSGEVRTYNGIFLQISETVSFYCCRRVSALEEAERLRSENLSLRENMQELVLRFQEGIAAFEVKNGLVTPLYASDNVCAYFGYSRNEWLQLMEQSTPLPEFIQRSGTSYDDFAALLKAGEAEFTYRDVAAGKDRRIKAICSPKSPKASPRYVLLYNVDENESAAGSPVSIRTFGYFDVFVGGRPIAFRSQKSKELFALLVDRRGGFVSSEEAIGFLWEDEPVSPVTLARYRKVALRLKNILEEYGISDIVESVDGKRRIVMEKVRCDLYDYLSGKEEYANLFKGSYLTNYSWGETTLGELIGDRMAYAAGAD